MCKLPFWVNEISPLHDPYQEPKLSDWLWEIRERRKQRDRSLNYRALLRLISDRNNAQSDDTSNVTTNSSRDASGRPTISMTVEQYLTYGNLVNEERLNAHRIKQEREEAAIPAGNQQNNRQGVSLFDLNTNFVVFYDLIMQLFFKFIFSVSNRFNVIFSVLCMLDVGECPCAICMCLYVCDVIWWSVQRMLSR